MGQGTLAERIRAGGDSWVRFGKTAQLTCHFNPLRVLTDEFAKGLPLARDAAVARSTSPPRYGIDHEVCAPSHSGRFIFLSSAAKRASPRSDANILLCLKPHRSLLCCW
jgi:hypothetical protein